MAFLWWHGQRRHVSEALSGIGELKDVAANSLKERGFTDVRTNDLEVAGGKAGTWVSIGHFPISGRDYWEVIMGSGDSDSTRTTVDEAAQILAGLRFL
jgi:hypothetical protein